MRRGWLLPVLALGACAGADRTAGPAEKPVAALYDKYLERKARLDPNWATEQGIHTHDHLLTRYDDATRDANRKLVEEMLGALSRLDLKTLAQDQRLDMTLWRAQLETELYDVNRVDERTIGPGIPIGALSVIYTLLVKDFAPLAERAQHAVDRLQQVSIVVRDIQPGLANPPRVWTEMAIADAKGAAETVDEIVRLAKPGVTDVAHLERVAMAARRSLESYTAFLETDLLPRSKGEFAVGKATYEYYLKHYHLVGLDADSLEQIGHRQWKLTIQLLEETAKKIDPAKTWQAILKDMKKDHPTSETLVETYRKACAKARQYMIDHRIVTLPPGEQLEIVETPAFERSGTPYAAYHSPGPLDSAKIGHFYVTPVDPKDSPGDQEMQLAGHNVYDIPGTVWHEAYPGHHTQFVYAKTIESKVRALNNSPLLSEGWGFYCEELAFETGYYTDPRDRLMQLNWRLQRAARIILDVSIHTGKMTYEQAVQFLMKEVQMEKPHAEGSVNAYTQRPTYFMAYMVGMLEIVRVRDEAKARLGSRFTLREFHDRVLKYGNVPPGLIEQELLRDWK